MTTQKLTNSTVIQLTDAAQSIVTASTVNQLLVLQATVTNNDTTDHTVTVHLVEQAGTADATNMIINAIPIGPGATLVLSPVRGGTLVNGQSYEILSDSPTSLCNAVFYWQSTT